MRRSLSGLIFGLVGLAVLAWMVSSVGVSAIVADVSEVGWTLIAIVAIGGLRFLLRAAAWRMCLEPPHALSLGDAFAAVVCGDTIGNLTPLGPLVGEPAKAAFVRGRVALAPAVTALAIENVLYTLSAAAMIAAGTVALLVQFQLPSALRGAGEAAVAATLALFTVALWMLWRQPALISRALAMAPPLRRHTARIQEIESQIYSFASRHRRTLPWVAAAEIGFHALGVTEIYVTLWALSGTPPPAMTAFILETTNRLVTVVFKIVPMRVGVDEAVTVYVSQLLGLGPRPGLALPIIRKLRILFWAITGGALLVHERFVPRAPQVPQDQAERG
jgi:lysylphosphatidylglycerol synthase-like protein